MAVTTLDPRTALIVIDLQKGLMGLPTIHPIIDVVQRAAGLAAAFRARGLPVVLVNVAGAPAVRTEKPRRQHDMPADWAELVAELNQQAGDHLVTKFTPGAFTRTDLEAYLKANGVTQVVLAGVATSNGVEVTARQAYELGLNLAFATDAMTDGDAAAHSYSLERVFPKIGETATTDEIIALLPQAA